MMRFLGWLLVVLLLLGVFGFFMDWVDLSKHNTPGRCEITLGVNGGKVKSDFSDAYHTVEGWFK